MIIRITDNKKWMALALILLLFYAFMCFLWATIRIKYPDIDGSNITALEKIRSSFIGLSPNLLLFSWFVFRIYRQNKNK